jgi:hypothetical protein
MTQERRVDAPKRSRANEERDSDRPVRSDPVRFDADEQREAAEHDERAEDA